MSGTVVPTTPHEFVGIPVVSIRGSAFERGVQYGEQVSEQIHRSQAAYEKVYSHFARWDWSQVREVAATFIDPIQQFDSRYLNEMRGIAVGSGLDFLDVLAMNLRTEILFAAKARQTGAILPQVAECTTFADTIGSSGRVLGQNWDWMVFAQDTIVLIEAVPEHGPRWMTVVEAGLLAKFGMNSAGIAVTTNALVTSADIGTPGVPYHVMLRALLDCTSLVEMRSTLERAERSSSANYMLAGDGEVVNAETRPGGADDITWTASYPHQVLLHTNHFSETRPLPSGLTDVGITVMPDTVFRLERAHTIAHAEGAEATQDIEWWKQLLSDHAGFPDSLCCHPNPGLDEIDQGVTVASVIFEPTKRRAHLAIGTPCTSKWLLLDYTAFFEWTFALL